MKCGVGAYTQRLARALAELQDVKVTVLTDERASGVIERDGVEVLPVIKGWRITELIRVAKYVRRLSPDIVHIQYPTQGYSGRIPTLLPLLMRFLCKPCVQTWHEPALGRRGLWLSIGLDELITVREELMTKISRLTQRALRNTRLSWIPAASLLPTVTLHDDERLKIRHRYVSGGEVLLVYYGFVAPLKGIEVLLEIVAKTNARLLMACDFQPGDNYHRLLLNQITAMGIASCVTITGFLPDEQLAYILAACDAVVLPFRDGAKACNSTIDGAVAQGAFVLTTSLVYCGYNKDKNIYFAKPGNVEEMIAAIQRYAGCRIPYKPSTSEWHNIAKQHLNIYNQLVTI
jgi:glycosyltransferase involved in cell wall biosynthesis